MPVTDAVCLAAAAAAFFSAALLLSAEGARAGTRWKEKPSPRPEGSPAPVISNLSMPPLPWGNDTRWDGMG